MKIKRLNRFVSSIIIGLVVLGITACDYTKKWEKQERDTIQHYLNSLGDTAYVLKPSGLYFIDLIPGTGRMPESTDTVFFKGAAYYLDGKLFASNLDDSVPSISILGSGLLVYGLDEGFRYMKAGGKARFITPSSLAYGTAGAYGVPGYTPLRWDIELDSVIAGPGVK
jgi:FKBP-type peptidyl-prolyl cis-trans isomerase